MAKDTLVRMSYSIGEKIIKSMAEVPVTYGRKDIDVFKKKDPPRQHTLQTTPKPASGSASKSRIDPRSKALRNIGIGFGFSEYSQIWSLRTCRKIMRLSDNERSKKGRSFFKVVGQGTRRYFTLLHKLMIGQFNPLIH